MVKKKNTKDYIRKKYLKIRTIKSPKKLNFKNIFSLIRKNFSNKRIIIAAYYPYNYEVNVLPFVKLANMKN